VGGHQVPKGWDSRAGCVQDQCVQVQCRFSNRFCPGSHFPIYYAHLWNRKKLRPIGLINISEPHANIVVKIGENSVRNRSRTDEIDAETENCTSLEFEFHFRFCWPPKYEILAPFGFLWRSAEKRDNRNCETAKIRFRTPPLPVCLRNNRRASSRPPITNATVSVRHTLTTNSCTDSNY